MAQPEQQSYMVWYLNAIRVRYAQRAASSFELCAHNYARCNGDFPRFVGWLT